MIMFSRSFLIGLEESENLRVRTNSRVFDFVVKLQVLQLVSQILFVSVTFREIWDHVTLQGPFALSLIMK